MFRRYATVLRREKQPMRFLASRALMYSGLSPRLVIQKRGFRLRFYPTNATAQQWVDPYHHHDLEHGYREESFFQRYLRPGDIVVDVGANFGLTALAAWSIVGPAGEVHAFEPHPRIFRFLKGNIELNRASGVIRPYNLALGKKADTAFLTDYRADDQNSISKKPTDLRVRMSRLDEVAGALQQIALLKIDVEGYEKFVLEGSTETLARADCVYFESYAPNYAQFGYTLQDIVEFLNAQRLEVRRVGSGGSTTGVASGEVDAQPQNLVAVHDVEHLRSRLEHAPSRSGADQAA